MFEHDCDTDEDCEVYFLKPVNEYNIVDKIKEANKELFDDGEDSIDTPDEQRRKVKFHPNLEQYEGEPSAGEDDAAGEEHDLKCPSMATLNEEEDDVGSVSNNEEDTSPRTITTMEECAEMLALEVQKKIEAIEIKMAESENDHDDDEEEEDVDEISEEIVVMDMETGKKLEEDTKEINSIKENVRSELIKQMSMSKDVDSDDEVPDEQEEGDDNLSIIVASYLPSDAQQAALDESDNSSIPKTHSFKRNFSFRRKNSGRRNKCHSPDITNLKLNYKTCCEYRNSDCAKLPKYTGYMSEYGLSRDQLEKREQSLQSKHKVIVEKNLKATEADVQKMQDNERAFTTWLKNKMRFPINRTKNMFDVKKTNNMNSGNNRGGVFRPKLCGSNKNGGVL
ncbi:serine/threonine-protein kinase rio2 [Eupeodes corollae]|uniref:serine/threonine-protein kinase rio2 n=1 Tax=Eupeodes corollae TaxID=290404 RepID=UPI002492A98E|nr:serine/threonine-protein kinase rio2 [Eupeodes corollae]